jgi:hypothetical protein
VTTVTRKALPHVELPTEEVEVAPLGGSVIVRGLSMPQMLQWSAERRRLLTPLDGESEEAAKERAGAYLVPLLLSMCVVLDDGLPVYTSAQWAAWGVSNPGEVMTLFQAAVRLSGQDADEEKKT